jgi:hypothetical protein
MSALDIAAICAEAQYILELTSNDQTPASYEMVLRCPNYVRSSAAVGRIILARGYIFGAVAVKLGRCCIASHHCASFGNLAIARVPSWNCTK